uniref:Uncharacterized protein n=1 Tax=Globodera pallida TaxID=36090 RepID=A0A183BYQ6_GLOPA
MRTHDQAIRNMQGLPGGEAALQRLYEQVQEPLMNTVLGQPGVGNATNPPGRNATGDARELKTLPHLLQLSYGSSTKTSNKSNPI